MQRPTVQFKIQKCLLTVALFSVATPVFASEMFFDTKTNKVRIGEKFEVQVFVNAEQESINAFEGEILFPQDLVDLQEIRDGDSIVNFWIDPIRNCVSNGIEKPDSICFSGITPGGFNGEKGLIFLAIFEAKKAGIVPFEIHDARVLRNDGAGSQTILTVTPLKMEISKDRTATERMMPRVRDTEKPELFVPEIAKDASVFEGKRFLAFATQDKVSGIDHYTVKESRQRIAAFFAPWKQAQSPYVLGDQELRSYIFVKAVDKAGNERIVKINPQNPLAWYENYTDWVIMIGGVLIAAFAARKLWRKKRT